MDPEKRIDALLLRLDELKEVPLSGHPVTKLELVTLTQIVSDLIEIMQDQMIQTRLRK